MRINNLIETINTNFDLYDFLSHKYENYNSYEGVKLNSFFFDLSLDTDTHPDPDLTDMNVDDELPIDTDSTFDPTDSNINIDSDIDMGTGDLEQSEAAVSILSACDTIQNSIKDLKVSEFKQIVKRLQDLSTSARAMGVDFLPESRKVK